MKYPSSSLPKRATLPLSLFFLALTLVVGLFALPPTPGASAATQTVGLLDDDLTPSSVVADTSSVNVGVRFESARPGKVTALQFYRSAEQEKAYTASLWDLNGTLLGQTTFPASSTPGWQTAALPEPVNLNKGRHYVASYLASDGQYAVIPDGFDESLQVHGFTVPAGGGVSADGPDSVRPRSSADGANFLVDIVFDVHPRYVTPEPEPTEPEPTEPEPTDPEPTEPEPTEPEPTEPEPTEPEPTDPEPTDPEPTDPEPTDPEPTDPEPTDPEPTDPEPTPGDWPAAHNTGVPEGTTLTPYTGPLTITTPNTVIRNAVVDGRLRIEAPGVQIINSRINGTVDLRSPRTNDYSFSIVDSEVHIGDTLNTGLMRGNFTATRVEVTGGRRSIYCEINCVVEDSWVHAQGGDEGGDAHFSGIRMGESTTLRHNTITCEALRGPGTGCSAGLTGYGDFGPVQNNLIENNIFLGGGGGGSTFCAYGGSSGDNGGKPFGHLANHIRFVDNVFVRGETGHCGNIRAVASFDPTRPGNVWSGNTWDDGSTINYND